MLTLKSYLLGDWIAPAGPTTPLVNPATEEPIGEVGTPRVDFARVLAYARDTGGPALRARTFAERGEMLRAISRLIHARRDDLIELAILNGGNTRGDAKFDIDGASGTLAAYADVAAALGAERILVEGEGLALGRSARFHGLHVWTPRQGAAVHINAFNFPAWGFAEKAAVALLAGVPVVTKPASATALLAHRILELVVAAKVLPDGALQLIAGGTGDLLAHLGPQDTLAFTGSGETAAALRVLPSLARHAVRMNVEADSLNAAVLGPDCGRGTPAYDLFLAHVVKEMTQKTGQKCTATRRILVPLDREADVREDLADRLSRIKVGNPALEEVTMGPLSSAAALAGVRAGLARLLAEGESVFGGSGDVTPIGAPAGKGFFLGPVLLRATDSARAHAVHDHEVFGPVATLLPYDGTAAAAVALVARGGGGLVCSAYSDEREFLRDVAIGLAPHHGRLLLVTNKLADQALQPGIVLPSLVHGGPGRAGGGEELGGPRGLAFYMQRTALQGDRAFLQSAITGARVTLP
jgi:oxepin-CoA hydrolase/3-oxo-5,6-dehydrosuberyl-CoA semialdehyde dehydrogenase